MAEINDMISLEQLYDKALLNKDNWKFCSGNPSQFTCSSIFDDRNRNSILFVKEYFKREYDCPWFTKARNLIDKITPFRASHTVSSLLFGITVRENLALDIRDWPRLYEQNSSNSSFMFFWPLICLFHDAAYAIETSSKKGKDKENIKDNATLKLFLQNHPVKYNLIKETKYKALIENYYLYRTSEGDKPCVDHGIAGAILLYDALMIINEASKNAPSDGEPEICGMRISDGFPSFCLRICEAIAVHNMWRANEKTINLYLKYKLHELIPNDKNDHLVYYEDNTLLFLLSLIDTIDPIKWFGQSRQGPALKSQEILEGYKIGFIKYSGMKRVEIYFDHDLFTKYVEDMCRNDSWLGAKLENREILSITVIPKAEEEAA